MDLFDFVESVVLEDEKKPIKHSVLQVSELSGVIKEALEGFGVLVVEGEISGGKLAASGHFYADLKDEKAVISVVAWRSTVQKWVTGGSGVPQNGTRVVLTGRLTTYPGRGQYQLIVDKIETAGLGALMQQLEALKRELAAEGLFDQSRKQPLPELPAKIGMITSAKGSVIMDMLHRLAERCPRPVLLWPVPVQGPTAAELIAAAIDGMNALPLEQRPDVLIVARGGGSFEDLMPFNDERVVRAIAASALPVISGVGHEPDVTLCDLVADVRAPTPTAAAEYAVPVAEDVLYGLEQQRRRLSYALRGMVQTRKQRIELLARMLPDPRRQVMQAGMRIEQLAERLDIAMRRGVQKKQDKINHMARLLLAHNPESPLERGFALISQLDGRVVRSANDAHGRLTLRFKDGSKQAEVLE